jgi:hypothetical protein
MSNQIWEELEVKLPSGDSEAEVKRRDSYWAAIDVNNNGYLSLADFVVAEDSHYIERLFPEEYKTFSFLGRIREEFERLPEIVSYYEQPSAFKGRFFPEYAALSVEQ